MVFGGVHGLQTSTTLTNHVFKWSAKFVGGVNNLTNRRCCCLSHNYMGFQGYKVQLLCQLKSSGCAPNSEGLLMIHSRSRVNLELLLKRSSALPLGTSWRAAKGLGEVPRCAFMHFCLTHLECVYSVWVCYQSPPSSRPWAKVWPEMARLTSLVKVRWKVMMFFVLYSLDLSCAESDCDPCFMMWSDSL